MLRHIFFGDMRQEFCGKEGQEEHNGRLKTGEENQTAGTALFFFCGEFGNEIVVGNIYDCPQKRRAQYYEKPVHKSSITYWFNQSR